MRKVLRDGVSPGRATLDHSASLNVECDLDLKVHVALDDWTPATNMAFMSKFIGSTDRSFILQVFTSGTLRLIWTTDGTAGTQVSATSTVPPPRSDARRARKAWGRNRRDRWRPAPKKKQHVQKNSNPDKPYRN